MAGLGGALAGLAGSYNQAWDEERRLTMAARLEKQRDENRIRITPTDSTLTRGPDGVIYRQAVNALGEPIGPQRALSDMEAETIKMQQEEARLGVDAKRAGLDFDRARTAGQEQENKINAEYGPQRAQQALSTSRAQELAARASAGSSSASAARANLETSLLRDRDKREQEAFQLIDETIQADGPPSLEGNLLRAGALLSPTSSGNTMTALGTQGLGAVKSDPRAAGNMGKGMLDILSTYAEDADLDMEEDKDKYDKIMQLRMDISNAAAAGDTATLQKLGQQVQNIVTGKTTDATGKEDPAAIAARQLAQELMGK